MSKSYLLQPFLQPRDLWKNFLQLLPHPGFLPAHHRDQVPQLVLLTLQVREEKVGVADLENWNEFYGLASVSWGHLLVPLLLLIVQLYVFFQGFLRVNLSRWASKVFSNKF